MLDMEQRYKESHMANTLNKNIGDETLRLIDLHRSQSSGWNHRQKADMEAAIWESVPATIKHRIGANRWRVSSLLPHTPAAEVYDRVYLFYGKSNPHANLLQDAVTEGKIPLRVACRLLMNARRLANPTLTHPRMLSEAIAAQYAEYVLKESIPKIPRLPKEHPKLSDRYAWSAMMGLFQGIVSRRTATAPDRARIQNMAHTEFATALHGIQNMLRHALKSTPQTVPKVSTRQLRTACAVLGVPPPAKGPVDLVLAARNKRSLALAYHPDRSQTHRSQFEAVIEAYTTLVEYNSLQ